jgi:hypothetical protein
MAVPDLSTTSAFDVHPTGATTTPRLHLVSCALERGRGATSRVTVEFSQSHLAVPLVCRQEGPTCVGGDLRLAALATLDAVTQSTDSDVRLELVGVKPMRAFDTNLMVVALLALRDGASTRIVGTAIAEDDQLMGVARATLHAVNRLIAPHLTRLDPFE